MTTNRLDEYHVIVDGVVYIKLTEYNSLSDRFSHLFTTTMSGASDERWEEACRDYSVGGKYSFPDKYSVKQQTDNMHVVDNGEEHGRL